MPPNAPTIVDSIQAKSTPSPSTLAVVYLCDENYHEITEYSICSVAMKNRAGLKFFFYQIDYEKAISGSLANVLDKCGHQVSVLRPEFPSENSVTPRESSRNFHVSKAAIYKAHAVSQLSESFDYVLYIDSDILCFRALDFEAALPRKTLMSAVNDVSVRMGFEGPLDNLSAYFNSGLMFFNSKKWRETSRLDSYIEYINRHTASCDYLENCGAHDQCAFNYAAEDDWVRLPYQWNAQKLVMHTPIWSTAYLRHYTGSRKFLPVRNHRCDADEFNLIRSLSSALGRKVPSHYIDCGALYFINALRRKRFSSTLYNKITAPS